MELFGQTTRKNWQKYGTMASYGTAKKERKTSKLRHGKNGELHNQVHNKNRRETQDIQTKNTYICRDRKRIYRNRKRQKKQIQSRRNKRNAQSKKRNRAGSTNTLT